MPTNIIMPQMGESVFEGTITRWLKKEGDRVLRDEPLFEISTDKVDTEIPSPVGGILRKIICPVGAKVPIHTVVAIVDESGAPAEEAVPRGAAAPVRAEPAPVAGLDPTEAETRRFAPPAGGCGTGAGGPPRPVAAEGPLLLEVSSEAPLALRDQVVPMSPMRERIAEHMVRSRRTAAHAATVFEADVTRIVEIREREKRDFEIVTGTRLTYTPFFAAACVQALREFPILNSSVEGKNIVYRKEIHLGVAVALPDGLIVPVIRNAGERSFVDLCRTLNDLAERARTKRLSVEEVQGGTFTITNPGPYGGLFGTPIINQPQVAILGIGTIERRPVVVHEAIAIRSMCYLCLSFDHRVVDGAVADRFMARLKGILQEWTIPIR